MRCEAENPMTKRGQTGRTHDRGKRPRPSAQGALGIAERCASSRTHFLTRAIYSLMLDSGFDPRAMASVSFCSMSVVRAP